jgi:dTDP-4-dehydrorhamnose reductase
MAGAKSDSFGKRQKLAAYTIMNWERALITGSEGMVGSYIDFGIRTNRQTLDVTNREALLAFVTAQKPELILHIAAQTDLVLSEREPAQAYAVNSVGTYNVALAARAVGAKLVYLSTSGVFDGTKNTPYVDTDIPNPVNEYGHSKYLGELAVQGVCKDFLIVRTSWIFGGGKERDKKFVGKVLSQISQPEIRAVGDKKGSPTYAKDLVAGIKKLVEENKIGIFHLSGTEATRFDIAKEIIAVTGSKAKLISVKASDFPSAYKSGDNESMASSPYMRPWQDALKEYITTEWL